MINNYYVNNCNDCIKNNVDSVIINTNRNDKSCLCGPGFSTRRVTYFANSNSQGPQGIQGEPGPAGGL